VAKLTEIDANHGPLTAADGAAMKQRFAELKAQGAVAVPAIREFLIKNQDLAFEASEVIDATGVRSLRLGFIDVLRDIEGPEAVALSTETLRSTGDPVEIATLAGILEKNEPGEHRQEAVKAPATR